MKTKILMLAALAALVSCNSGSTLEKEIGKSLSKAENIKGYEFIDQAVSKNATIDDCLSWEAKTAQKSLSNIKLQEEWYGGHLATEKQNTIEFSDGIERLRKENQGMLSNNYGKILKIKFKNKENGELVESSRYFIVDNEDKVLYGPYLKYEEARDEYRTMTLSHLEGYKELRANFVPYEKPE